MRFARRVSNSPRETAGRVGHDEDERSEGSEERQVRAAETARSTSEREAEWMEEVMRVPVEGSWTEMGVEFPGTNSLLMKRPVGWV